ncbi:c6 zinc finger domain-containing protein [Dendryphion nanum]|uniref:C6 zinc finger domain-containing protein n=1 Tax=Dendryphion nanum TaxID=256645 RepID=A0A9P9CWY7_9PLEO|nr:c6 zinc finger domain-containing protein [Dendryphion nanum]
MSDHPISRPNLTMASDSTVNASTRTRLACASCTRRKVKCSKTIPCTNCVRRGEQSTCGLSCDDVASPVHSTSLRPPSARPPSSRDQELEYFRRKIAELEKIPSMPVPVDPTLQYSDREQMHNASARLTVQSPSSPSSPSNIVEETTDASNNQPQVDQASGEITDVVAQDAASILEFLAWGRRKDPEYHTVVSPEAHHHESTATGAASDSFDECSSLHVLQLLLPSPRQVWLLIDWHEECLLWYHGSYFAPTFRAQTEFFFSKQSGIIQNPSVNLQWVALLFSVMTASLACAPQSRAQQWGFRDAERETLSKRWFQATITCLNRADYTTNLTIFSCQAIATATISAHMLGYSNSQSIHLAAATRIAQSLALHRLGADARGNTVEKEIGRRVWAQLCSQDWFGIPFSESYLINPLYMTSEPPTNCHDHDMVELPTRIPTITSYCRFLHDIAAIMPQLQDGLMSCNTPYTRYEQVLKWDKCLRTLSIQERPIFLTNSPLDPTWPSWVPWGRRALAISSSHKIIMIHRSFLSDSFTNPAFAFTRRTCLAASKTIIKEYKCVVEEDGPILWIHQAFSVAASIILLLDILHRDPSETECAEHRQLVEDTMKILRTCRNSMIATRGIDLLGALLVEVSKTLNGDITTSQGRKRARDGSIKFSVPAFVKGFCVEKSPNHQVPHSRQARQDNQNAQGTTVVCAEQNVPGHMAHVMTQSDQMEFGQMDLNFAFPPAGLDGTNGFENLLYLANHDFAMF